MRLHRIFPICTFLFLLTIGSTAIGQDTPNLHLFVRVGNQDSIDENNVETPISLEPGQTFLGQLILREQLQPGETTLFPTNFVPPTPYPSGLRSSFTGIEKMTTGATTLSNPVSPYINLGVDGNMFPIQMTTPGFPVQRGFVGLNGDESTIDAFGNANIKGITQGKSFDSVRPGGGVTEIFAGQFDINFAPDGATTDLRLFAGSGILWTVNDLAGTSPSVDDHMIYHTATIVAAIPEPSSFMLLGLGSAGIVMRRRRR